MISNAFNIGVSGLKTSQRVIDMLSHNIANVDTPGFKRQENNNVELNFSGPNNNPYLPAGVDTTISTASYPWLDRRMNDALHDKAMNDAIVDGLDDVEKMLSDNTLSESFSEFMNSSQALMQDPSNIVLQEKFNQSGKSFTENLNRVDAMFAQSNRLLQDKIDMNNIRLQTLQQRMAELTSKSNSQDVVSEMNFLKQQISQVTGSIAGYNKVIRDIIPPVTGLYDQAKQEVVNGTNNSYGENLIQTSDQGYSWEMSLSGNLPNLVEFGNQQFNWDLGRIKTVVGSMLESANIGASFSGQNLDATAKAYDAAYGVDLVDQSVKMKQYQRMYEANAQVIKTADNMLGSLLNIFS